MRNISEPARAVRPRRLKVVTRRLEASIPLFGLVGGGLGITVVLEVIEIFCQQGLVVGIRTAKQRSHHACHFRRLKKAPGACARPAPGATASLLPHLEVPRGRSVREE